MCKNGETRWISWWVGQRGQKGTAGGNDRDAKGLIIYMIVLLQKPEKCNGCDAQMRNKGQVLLFLGMHPEQGSFL